ncbi:hypothetical protein [Mesorhizobium kowhaii]|nr:hypothetical protein [Mesorhizobium kowhaii]
MEIARALSGGAEVLLLGEPIPIAEGKTAKRFFVLKRPTPE